MKRSDAFKRIALSLALIGFLGCDRDSNKGQKKELEDKIAEAEANNNKSVSMIKVYEAKMEELKKEEAEAKALSETLNSQNIKWSNDRSDRTLQLSVLNRQVEQEQEKIRSLSASRSELEGLVAAETEKLKQRKIEIEEAKVALASQITAQKEVVSKAKAEVEAAKSSAQSVTAQAQADAQDIRNNAEQNAATIVSDAEAVAQVSLDAALLKEAELNQKEADLQEYSDDLADEASRLSALSTELETKRLANEAQEKLIQKRQKEFNAQVNAARTLFLNNGREDLFEGLVAGKSYPFMITVVGTGDYKVLKSIRSDIDKMLKGNKYAKHKKINPVTQENKESFAALSNKDKDKIAKEILKKKIRKQMKLEDGRWVINNVQSTDSVNVRDAFLMDSTMGSIAEFETAINKKIDDKFAVNSKGANFWVSVRPVQDVEVSAEVKIYGAKGYGPDLKEKMIKKVSVEPKKMSLENLTDVDLTNLSKNIFGNDTDGCTEINAACLTFLKQNGVLAAKDKDGVSIEENLEKYLKSSIDKVELEQQIGFGSVQNLLLVNTVFAEETTGYLWWKKTQTVVKSEIDPKAKEELEARYLDLQNSYEELKSKPTLTRVTMSLKVKSIFDVSEGRTTVDSAELMNLGSVVESAINKSEVSKRGVIEVEVPISGGNFVTSNLPSTSTKNFTSDLVEPVKPVMPDTIGLADSPILSDYDDELIRLNKGLESGRVSKEQYNRTKAMLDYRAADAKYKIDMQKYVDALEKQAKDSYEQSVKDLLFDLQTLQKGLDEA